MALLTYGFHVRVHGVPPPPWCNSPSSARASPLSGLHEHTQTHQSRKDSSGRVISSTQRPLPETAQQSSRRDSNPQSQQASGCRPTALDRAATGTGVNGVGPIGLAYPCYNFLFYGMSPISKPTAIATKIYPER